MLDLTHDLFFDFVPVLFGSSRGVLLKEFGVLSVNSVEVLKFGGEAGEGGVERGGLGLKGCSVGAAVGGVTSFGEGFGVVDSREFV